MTKQIQATEKKQPKNEKCNVTFYRFSGLINQLLDCILLLLLRPSSICFDGVLLDAVIDVNGFIPGIIGTIKRMLEGEEGNNHE